ncbi:hypothetical protein AAFF_G00079150 [Aldrovandia affinis]|uniref:Dynein heavy chain domain-containing protein 1 n=1 Tax=Aldrovandia affinis TaxID=143900 RepID=A0AAD7RXA5_9TELE|nr:hypothetical protein AAFF_G00079150 [Aldrovandia affinis]
MPVEKLTDILSAVKRTKQKLEPVLTGMEVVEIFMKKRHLGKLQFIHLKAKEGGAYRPYDLGVVPHDQAGPEHYIFSPTSVLHVRDGCSVGFQTLSEWHREAMLWNVLQGLTFFRDFLLRRVFVRWRRNVRQNALQCTCALLQGQLLLAVPQFREGILQVSRLIEELKKIHWLPQDDSQTYTLQDFHSALLRKNKEAQAGLEKFLQYRALILSMVREDSYRAQQELQRQVELVELSPPGQPLHLQRAGQRRLRQDLGRAESALQRLGNMAALVDHMTAQSLVTIARREVTHFVSSVLTRRRTQRGGLFRTELVFGTEGQLSLDPPTHLFQEALQGALFSVADSVLQVFDSYRFSTELKDGVITSTDPHGLAPDPRLACINGFSGPTDPGGRDGELRNDVTSRPVSPAKLVLPNMSPPSVVGQKLRGQYYPLSRQPVEWQLSVSGGNQEAQREQAAVTQEAFLEVQQLCEGQSWLVDVRLTCGQWNSARLEAMRGWPSQRYQEHIQRVRAWAERVRTLPVSFTTSNRLITVHCTHIRDEIAPLLASLEEEVRTLLVEQVRLRSMALVSELERAADWLRAEPTDLDGYSQQASTVKRYEGMCGDLQLQQRYLRSLQETVRLNYGPVSSEEDTLGAQVQDHWNHFLPLLKEAGETVRRRAPSMADALDRTVSSRARELQGLVSRATSGPYLDPSQEPAPVVARLQSMCGQFCAVAAQLQQLSETSVIIRGKPLDLSLMEEERQKLEARRGLWELLRASASYIQEWRRLLFSKFVVLRAQEKVNEWLRQAALLEGRVPPQDAVLKRTLQLLGDFSQQLPLLAKLGSPVLKHKHWRNIFKGMELLYTPEWELTVADLLSKKLLDHQNMINKVCEEAKAEADMEQAFRKLQQRWEGMLFRLANFLLTMRRDEEPHPEPMSGRKTSDGHTPKHGPRPPQSRDSGTFTIIGLEALLAQTEDSVATLSSMLLSPHAVEFRLEVERWVQRLQQLEELLDVWKTYQLKWAFLSKMFHESQVMIQKPELYQQFLVVDVTYREMIQTMSGDPRVLNFVQLGHGERGLRALLAEGLSTMEGISARLLYLLDPPRDRFPRLRFLSDGEVMELLSLHPAPSTLLPLVRKCFQGVRHLEVAHSVNESPDVEETGLCGTQPWVRGAFGGLGERVPFLCPLEPSLDSLAWLCQLEQRMLAPWCSSWRNAPLPGNSVGARTLPPGGGRGSVVQRGPTGFPEPCTGKPGPAKGSLQCQAAKPVPAHSGQICGSQQEVARSPRETAVLRAMVLLAIKHSNQLSGLMELKCDLEVSFEWQRLMKYHLSTGDQSGPGSFNVVPADGDSTEPSCYVDVLSSRLPYGYEYLGPEHWTMVNTPSSDRASLGILLALTCYRCSFVRGPSMSGKTETVANLGGPLANR